MRHPVALLPAALARSSPGLLVQIPRGAPLGPIVDAKPTPRHRASTARRGRRRHPAAGGAGDKGDADAERAQHLLVPPDVLQPELLILGQSRALLSRDIRRARRHTR